jgi:arylsulfatase A-like enzyme
VIAVAVAVPVRSEAQAMDPPTVIVIVTDDQRADTLRSMPTVSRAIVGNGTRFTKAFTPNALCCPARASILTGDHSHTTGVWRNAGVFGSAAFDDSSTLATWLDAAGYRTGLFGKYLNRWYEDDPGYVPPGWDRWFAFMSRNAYYGFPASVDGTRRVFGEGVYGTIESARRAAGFIASSAGPVFVYWAPSAPHAPATPETRHEGAFADLQPWRPPSYLERDVSDKPSWVRRLPLWTTEEIAAADDFRRRQYESLLSVDDGVRILLDALRSTGRLDNTVIIYTSDNGLMWGEHRARSKPFPWRSTHLVPLVVRYGGIRGGPAVSPSLVSTIDIAPTVAELAGADPGATDGVSLVPLLSGATDRLRRHLLLEHARGGLPPAYCGARSANRLFIRYATGEEEFYDYRSDRWELRNAVDRQAARRAVGRMRRFTRRACSPAPPGFSW